MNEEERPKSQAQLVQELRDIRDERRKIAKRDSELVDAWNDTQARLMAVLDEQGVKRISTDFATATITETEVPLVEDWDVFLDYMRDNDMMHLLQRRPATAAWRELNDTGQCPPGTKPYTKREISLRTTR